MSKILDDLNAQLAEKQAEAKALMVKNGVTTPEITAMTSDIQAIQAKIELQKQTEAGGSATKQETAVADEPADADDTVHSANVKAFRDACPNLYSRIVNDAKAEERQRMKDIDAIANQVGPKLLNEAKYEKPMSAKDLAFESMKVQQKSGQKFLDNFTEDTNESGVKGVGAAPSNLTGENDDQQRASFGEKVANLANKMIGR